MFLFTTKKFSLNPLNTKASIFVFRTDFLPPSPRAICKTIKIKALQNGQFLSN
jgi:hypothetical protein